MSISEKLSSVVDREAPGSGDRGRPLDYPQTSPGASWRRATNMRLQSNTSTPKPVFIAPLSTTELSPPAYNNLGWVRQMLGDAEGAELRYRQALDIDPNLRGARKNLLMLLVKSGRRKESFGLWRDELTSDQNPTIF